MKDFEFNEQGICTNPNVISDKCPEGSVAIFTAKYGDLWGYGLDIMCRSHGRGCGVASMCCAFVTEREAQKKATETISAYIKKREGSNSPLLSLTNRLVNPVVELSLF